jgi:hypothetical protein
MENFDENAHGVSRKEIVRSLLICGPDKTLFVAAMRVLFPRSLFKVRGGFVLSAPKEVRIAQMGSLEPRIAQVSSPIFPLYGTRSCCGALRGRFI